MLIEALKLFKLLVVFSIATNLLVWFKSVVATEELKLPILELNPLVVVATDDEISAIDVDIEELKVE